MKVNIRLKLLLGYAVVVSLLCFILVFGFKTTERSIQVQVRKIQLEKAQNASVEIQNFLTKIERDHLGVAKLCLSESEVVCQSYESDIVGYTLRQNDFIRKIFLLAPSGRELLVADRFGYTLGGDLGYEIPTGPFNDALNGEMGLSKVFFSDNLSAPQINVFTPIFSDDGEITGVVKSELLLDRLWDLIAQAKLGESGFAYLVDEEGRLIAHPSLELVLKGPNLTSRPIVAALLDSSGEQLKSSDNFYINEKGVEVFSNGLKIPEVNWVVIVEQSQDEAFSQIIYLRQLFLTTLVFSFLLLVAISIFLSETITRPIRKLRNASELIKKGQFDTRVEIKSRDEIGDLAESFNLMARRQKEAIIELEQKVKLLEDQREKLDQSARLLLRRDVDLRRTNEALEKEKENILAERNKLEVIIAGITDAVIVVDLKRRVVIFNRAAEEITGFKAEELLDKSIDQALSFFDKTDQLPPDQYCPIVGRGFEGVVFEKKNLKMITSHGKELFVDLMAATIKESVSVNLGCILTFHDVTKEKDLEQMKLDFVSMAAHELRTPLTAIRGYASQLHEEVVDQLSGDQRNYLIRLEVSANKLGQLISNLLNVSRIERGTFNVQLSPIDLTDLIQKTIANFEELIDSKNQLLEFLKPEKSLPMVMADDDRINQVLTNLLANATAYTDEGGRISISVKKVPSGKKKSRPSFLEVSIKDNGPGIPKVALPKLFTKFFRVSGVLEQGSKGTGLGLFICKSIVKMHRGDIWVESELGKGSTFIFTLPIVSQKDTRDKKSLRSKDDLLNRKTSGIILNRGKYPGWQKKWSLG